jgi:MerR family transcriptional regulator, thiopeptide resistance regulator
MEHKQPYTVKQLADMAGVSARTLHYYDEIGLLPPSNILANGYRQYLREDLLKLQQILFFREIEMPLKEIQVVLNQQGFDLKASLEVHKKSLEEKAERILQLIDTVDHTILHIEGVIDMSSKDLYQGFSDKQQKVYEDEILEKYGDNEVDQSLKNWNSYSPERQAHLKEQFNRIPEQMIPFIENGVSDENVQALVLQFHKHMENFYQCSYEILSGLGKMYVYDERFADNYRKVHPNMPEFLNEAIQFYCEGKTGFLPK